MPRRTPKPNRRHLPNARLAASHAGRKSTINISIDSSNPELPKDAIADPIDGEGSGQLADRVRALLGFEPRPHQLDAIKTLAIDKKDILTLYLPGQKH